MRPLKIVLTLSCPSPLMPNWSQSYYFRSIPAPLSQIRPLISHSYGNSFLIGLSASDNSLPDHFHTAPRLSSLKLQSDHVTSPTL